MKPAHSGAGIVEQLIYMLVFVELVAERFFTARIRPASARIHTHPAHFDLRHISLFRLIFSLYIIDKERDISCGMVGNAVFQVRGFALRQNIYCAKKMPVRGFFAHFRALKNIIISITWGRKGGKCAGAQLFLPVPSLEA